MFSNRFNEIKKFIPAILVIALVIGGISLWSAKSQDSCVNLVIDYGVLDSKSEPYKKCISVNGETTALDLLNSANFKLEGTAKYGNMVVCRLNNLPKANQPIGIKGHEEYIEECKDMPAEFAYWAVLEKRKQSIPNPADLNSKWAWAQVGVAELALNVGDSVAFVFADNGNVKFPE
jgi:hypothetical protein